MSARDWTATILASLLHLPAAVRAQELVPVDFEVPRLLETRDGGAR